VRVHKYIWKTTLLNNRKTDVYSYHKSWQKKNYLISKNLLISKQDVSSNYESVSVYYDAYKLKRSDDFFSVYIEEVILQSIVLTTPQTNESVKFVVFCKKNG